MTSSKFLETAISKTLDKKNENIENLTHDIKAYEKELANSKDLFKLTKNRSINHFFSFESIQEGIRTSKALRKLYKKDKIDENRKKLDFLIEKLIK